MTLVLIIGLGWLLAACLACLVVGRVIRVADARDQREAARTRISAHRWTDPPPGSPPWPAGGPRPTATR